jgi:hypothetical protein
VSYPPPPPFEAVPDVNATTWIDDRLMHRDRRAPGWLVGELVPSGFEAYARIFHRATRMRRAEQPDEWVTLRWAEIAERRGKVVHPRMQIESLIDNPDAFDYDHWRALGAEEEWFPPEETLEEVEGLALGTILSGFTASTQPAWFWLWDGYGDMGEEIRDLSRAMIHPGQVIRLRASSPLTQTALRHYLVFRGPLSGLPAWFEWRSESPNYWYPDDRAWVVATEIDGFSTFVGGTRSCVEAVLASPLLEVLPCELSDRHDAWSDEINGDPR